MPLSAGTKLGPYEILASLGAGGMGEVYRARDSRLERIVAIKVLPPHLSSNPDFRQRFEREARAVSALQHPNIYTLHDIGQQDGVDFLVLEFVEGETLDQRLSKGPLALDQVLRYGAEVAQALAAAHRQGIVHRDLKPGNIMLTKSGAKLLDFGLAKPAAESSALAVLPTDVTAETRKLTAEGTIVGTFQYMAPEQLEGKDADPRTDIFALGCVLYEMTAGKAAFGGKSRASLIAAILSSEPPPISALQPMTPPALDRVIRRCLAKDPDDRWQNAGDLASELKWIAEGGSQASAPAPVVRRRKNREHLAWALAALFALLAVAAGVLYLKRPHTDAAIVQAFIPAPHKTTYFFSGDVAGPPVISPDGTIIAFTALDEGGIKQLWIRDLRDASIRSLPDSQDASFPFWSPDSRSLAFFAGGKLKRVVATGGTPVTVCEAPNGRGGSWGSSDVIIFEPDTQLPIHAVPAAGGTSRPVTRIDPAKHSTHRWPQFLPDGKRFLYFASRHSRPHDDNEGIYVGSLDSTEGRFLTPSLSRGIAVSGYLLFLQGATLLAQPFDEDRAALSAQPVPVAGNVHYEEGTWRGVFDASHAGTLIYQANVGASGTKLRWYGRDGRALGDVADTGPYTELALSRDDRQLVVALGDPGSDVWVYDLEHPRRTRLTFDNAGNRTPVWSPDGSRVAFARLNGIIRDLYVTSTVAAGAAEPIVTSDELKSANDWSSDGKNLLFSQGSVARSIWWMALTGDRKPQQLVPAARQDAFAAQFSPDGHWVAYTSNETGAYEIYVTHFPEANGKWQISTNGGVQPRWRGDGRTITYFSPDQTVMEARVDTNNGRLQVLGVKSLFKVFKPSFTLGGFTYDVTKDGKRFLVNAATSTEDQPLTVVTNWTARLPAK